MVRPSNQQAYTVANGTSKIGAPVQQNRDPTTLDVNYTLYDQWQNTSTGILWELVSFTSTSGTVLANWVQFATNTNTVQTLTGNSGGAVGPTGSPGNINLLGAAGQIVVTGTPGTSTLSIALAGGGTAVDSFAPDTGTSPVVPSVAGLVNVKGQSVPNVSGIQVTGALNELDIAMFSPFAGDFTFTDSTSGATETLTVSNTSNTANSQAQINAIVAGGTAGDSWNQWTIGTSRSYALGIDNSNSDIFKLTSAAGATIDPSSGTTLISFDPVGSPSGNNFVDIPSPEVHIEFNGASEVVNLTVTNTNNADFANVICEASNKTGFFSSGIYTLPLYWNFGMASILSNAFCLNIANATQGPEGGTIRLRVDQTGAVTFNQAYTFPTADGTAGEVLTTNGAGTVTWSSSGAGGWSVIGASQTLAVNNGYFCTTGGALSLALPAVSAVGDEIDVVLDGSTSWTITQPNAATRIRIGSNQTTLGVGGSLASTLAGDSVKLVCETANARWAVISMIGNITVV